MEFCYISQINNHTFIEGLIYLLLLLEYSIIALVFIWLLKKSFKNPELNLLEYKIYASLIIISSILKVAMFINFCVFKDQNYMIFVIAYELPFNSSLTLIIFTW